MPECWLRTNRRATAAVLALPAVLLLLGLTLGLVDVCLQRVTWMLWLGAILATVAAITLALVWTATTRMRLGYEHGNLLVFLTGRQPIRVPIDVVEVFFLGQAPAMVKSKDGGLAEIALFSRSK